MKRSRVHIRGSVTCAWSGRLGAGMVLLMRKLTVFVATPSGRRRTFVMNVFCRTSEVLSPAPGGTRSSWGRDGSGNRGTEATFVEARSRRHAARWWACVAVSWTWRIEWTGVRRMLELHYVVCVYIGGGRSDECRRNAI